MKRDSVLILLALIATVCSFTSVTSAFAAGPVQEAATVESDAAEISASTISALKLRSIGPAFMSGRIGDLAIDPNNPNVWYVAAGSGNLWKTTNAGTTFEPIFDDQPSYSIGCVTIDPSNSNTLWVGTGENNGGRHIGFGDGIYVSHDAGRTFKQMGLKKTEHISKIIVHPKNPKVVFVASQGPLWSGGGERGLFKTTDGGETWTNVLSRGKYTGVTDVAMDPKNPNVLYAATHQRLRTVWALMNTGPESGIHKSTDGGATWVELKNGLPSGDKGKMSLQVSPQKSNVVYAAIELNGPKGGFWRSEDFGASWTKMSDYVAGGTGPHYYQEIYCDPHRFDVVYHANVQLGRTEDGGKTFEAVSKETKHVDNHAVAFSPTDPNFLLVGCDGGVYRSYDYAKTYQHCGNLPLTQYYKVDVDYDYPFYHVVGGTQDNNSHYGPTRTGNEQGIRNSDWKITIGGDGHDNAIDPTDPNIIYCESQQGYLRRYDRRTGQSVDIRPRPAAGEADFRFNWDSPILISPHDHKRLYFGSKHLHRSDDRGDSWATVSPDLSRNVDRFTLKMMDRVWSIDAGYDLYAMSQYGNITSISESPIEEGLLYVGTDDGLIQISEDGGENWRTVESIYGVPEYSFVNDIKADRHDANTLYACLDNHKTGDYKPYLVKSTDRGKTWSMMTGDLPDNHLVWRIEQDHDAPGLFFLGTEFGIFCSLNAGENWHKLSGAPTIPFRDLAIQTRENDLVGASFGRGFYVLDDYSPLRELSVELMAENEAYIFPIRDAMWYIPADHLGGPKGWQGDSFFQTPNPDFGAMMTYFVRDDLKTKKQIRQAAEAQLKQAGKDVPKPSWEELEAESLEEPPSLFFEISSGDSVVARVDGSTSKGIHRMTWDLRYTGIFGRGGPMVAPGEYSVQAFKAVDGEVTPLGEARSLNVVSIVESTLEGEPIEDTIEFQMEIAKLQESIQAATSSLKTALERIDAIQAAIKRSPNGTAELMRQARKLELSLKAAEKQLDGDSVKESKFEQTVPSVGGRVGNVLYGSLGNTYGFTKTQREQIEIAQEEFDAVAAEVRDLLEIDFKAFEGELNEAGIPWTSGRGIPDPAR